MLANIDIDNNNNLEINLVKVYGQILVEMPKDLYIPPNALEVFLNSFEGPLDLLLYLIRKQGINILDIPMAALTEQYLGYIEQIRATNFELVAEYLLMAATLIEIKTRMLLPQKDNLEDEDADPRAELVKKLISYEAIKEVANKLDQLPIINKDFYLLQVDVIKENAKPIQIQSIDLLQAFKNILEAQNLFNTHQIIKEQLSVREYMIVILKYMQQSNNKSNNFSFIQLLKLHNQQQFSIQIIVVYFIAMLELVKEGLVFIEQVEGNKDIYLSNSYAVA